MEVFREVNARREQHKGQAWLPEEILIKIQDCLKYQCAVIASHWSYTSPFKRGIFDTDIAMQGIEGPVRVARSQIGLASDQDRSPDILSDITE